MEVKIIATDMDGTLLNNRKEVPPAFIPWVKGHPRLRTVIASGRQYYTLRNDFEELTQDLIFIAENGSFIFEKDQMIYSDTMPAESVYQALDLLKSYPQITPVVCGAESAYMPHTDPEVENQTAIFYARLKFTDDLYAAAASDRIAGIALFIPDHGAEELCRSWNFSVPGLTCTVSGQDWIDIAKSGTNKGTAMTAIQKYYSIPPEECMAFGDYMNDYDLLLSCGESYAMANAVDEIKAIAKYIAPSNEEQGVMQILQKRFP